jgi:hypothetical protein
MSRLPSPFCANLPIVAMRAERKMPDESRAEASPPAPPELPPEKAFVVQLSGQTGPTLEPFAGRVEHLASGRRLRFGNFATFRAAVIRLLAEAKQP